MKFQRRHIATLVAALAIVPVGVLAQATPGVT